MDIVCRYSKVILRWPNKTNTGGASCGYMFTSWSHIQPIRNIVSDVKSLVLSGCSLVTRKKKKNRQCTFLETTDMMYFKLERPVE